jgi:hypothetical protein
MQLLHVGMCCLQDSSQALTAVSSLLNACLPSWNRRLLFETGLNDDDDGVFTWSKHYVFLFEYGSFSCPELTSYELHGTALEEIMQEHNIIEMKVRVFDILQ